MEKSNSSKDTRSLSKKAISRKTWIKCIIALAIYIAFLIWVKSWLGIILIPVIFDAYITKKIPWTWWKKSKNQAVHTVMSWVDAIVFALIAVYFVNIYIFQNYQIPSSSLEKSLLVGDYLFVSKMSYGPRVPNTPLSMPLTQHTLPIFNSKSYLEYPQWKYKRVPGFGTPQRGDIVVFNFPAGDTVALNYQQQDLYSLIYEISRELRTPIRIDSLSLPRQREEYEAMYSTGKNFILQNPQTFGKVITRPVDRRENYVKRCIALPGDELKIVEGQVYINGKAQKNPENMQFSYRVYTNGPIPDEVLRELHISQEDAANHAPDYSIYILPLTLKSRDALAGMKHLVSKIDRITDADGGGMVYPQNMYSHWRRDNYGPIWIPKKGETIQLSLKNLPIYERCITAYEKNKLEVKDGQIFINGKPATSYTFKMNYYWMMGDNRHNSLDSRYWGFVPEDHIVGKPIVVWLSLDKDRSLFDGKIRWNRFFKWVADID